MNADSTLQGSILESEWQRRVGSVERFRREQKEIWCAVDLLATTSLTAIKNAPRCPGIDMRAVTLTMLWHTVWDYQMDSVFLALESKLDQAYAGLRMASELARDCARIGESPENYELWSSRHASHTSERYKTIFRFNKSDRFEKKTFQLYNLASDYGVHSHQTAESYMEVCREMPEHGVVVLKPSEIAPFDLLLVWMKAFLPLHMCCIRSLPQDMQSHLAEEIRMFWTACEAVEEAVSNCIAPAVASAKAERKKRQSK